MGLWSIFLACLKRQKKMNAKEKVSALLWLWLRRLHLLNGMFDETQQASHCVQAWKAGRRGWSSQTGHTSVSPPSSAPGRLYFSRRVKVERMRNESVSALVCVSVCEPCFLWGVWVCVSPLSLIYSVWLPPSSRWRSGTAEGRASRQEVRNRGLKKGCKTPKTHTMITVKYV